ncbi:hypothetical protein [Mesonia sp. K7]|uniref:hypothetical protein n=1 Tax=Mesonia sp. K7 TaxID=2218606 RepID=UPI000DA90968|nr:hypothetical protein [Mesonia sp. K7]PZD76766.1 hypothetical protein DNG35_10920 [Mesonia sp. K7]
MKIKLLIFCVAICLLSCENSNKNDKKESIPFKITDTIKSHFEYTSDKHLKYYFKGISINDSEVFFEKVHVSIDIEFLMTNGKRIVEDDYLSVRIFGASFGSNLKGWKPQEKREIPEENSLMGLKELTSDFIPETMNEYPIDKVIAVYTFDTEDLMNDNKQKSYKLEINVTEQWDKLFNPKNSKN